MVQIDIELTHHMARGVPLDEGDRFAGDAVHVVPETLKRIAHVPDSGHNLPTGIRNVCLCVHDRSPSVSARQSARWAGERLSLEIVVELILGETPSIDRSGHTGDQLSPFFVREVLMVGDGTVGLIASPPFGGEPAVFEFSNDLRQLLAIVSVCLDEHGEENESVEHGRHDLGLVPGNEHGGALATMAHIRICERDAPIISSLLTYTAHRALVIELDVLGDELLDRLGGLCDARSAVFIHSVLFTLEEQLTHALDVGDQSGQHLAPGLFITPTDRKMSFHTSLEIHGQFQFGCHLRARPLLHLGQRLEAMTHRTSQQIVTVEDLSGAVDGNRVDKDGLVITQQSNCA